MKIPLRPNKMHSGSYSARTTFRMNSRAIWVFLLIGGMFAAISPDARGQSNPADSTPSAEPSGGNGIPAPPPVPRVIRSEAFRGLPYCLVQVTIPLKEEMDWRPDHPLTVRTAGDQHLFPCHEIRSTIDGDELIVRFLHQGGDSIVVDVETPAGLLVKNHSIRIEEDAGSHQLLKEHWWSAYTETLVDGPSGELSEVGREIATIVGRQFGLATPRRFHRTPSSSDLERQFERSVSMLFGFESVRLAMMDDAVAIENSGEAAVHPLPAPLQVRPALLPVMSRKKIDVERMAFYVPPECYYLRCQSLENYLWMRSVVRGWGGSLDQIVATPVIERQIRERLEQQLCLDSSLAAKLNLDEALDDFAIIGSDLAFTEGAGVGVLMLAKQPARVQAILDRVRRTTADAHLATHRQIQIDGNEVTLYETADKSIRSFLVSSDNCYLVTNSRHLVELFLACKAGQSLATLPEFRYARWEIPVSRELTSFLYLSDPFFRHVTSPATRTEASRRRLAATELRQLKLARHIAAAEGLAVSSIADLIRHRLLPEKFGKRSDGSSPLWTSDGRMVDSLRGTPGTFVPIADVTVSKITRFERDAYQQFTWDYLREWKAMDPVILAVHRRPTTDPNDEQVDLDIKVTPYAQNAYGFLARNLAPASRQQVSPPIDDILTLTARLQGSTTHDICVGLQDLEIPFHVENGSLIRDGVLKHKTFAEHRSYAAVTPAGIGGLMLLREFTSGLQSRELDHTSQPPLTRANDQASSRSRVNVLDPRILLLGDFQFRAFMLTVAALPHIDQSIKAMNVKTVNQWTLFAQDSEIRQQLGENLHLTVADMSSQIQFQVRDVNQSKVGPYLHAYSWETGRRVSGENSAWLHRLAQTLRLDLPETRQSIETILGGELCCRLGGTYELRHEGSMSQLVSTAWGRSSRFDEVSIPPSYRLPFLAWLRGLKLQFWLSPTTLTNHVELHVDPTTVIQPIHADQYGGTTPASIGSVSETELEQSYKELLVASHRLSRGLNSLDPTGAWTAYLQVPPMRPQTDSEWKVLRVVDARFERVATDPQYETITHVVGFAKTLSHINDHLRFQMADSAQ